MYCWGMAECVLAAVSRIFSLDYPFAAISMFPMEKTKSSSPKDHANLEPHAFAYQLTLANSCLLLSCPVDSGFCSEMRE